MDIAKIMLVLGARPQIIKSAPIVHAASHESKIEFEIVHTGQHYDYEMSKMFFDEMGLPDPAVNLGVGSGTHAWQTGEMMIRLEKAMLNMKPDIVMVPGDTNSTLAGALAGAKLQLPVAHIEAGARSYDMRMPEEVNRRLTDHCSRILFAPTRNCANNLRKEGIPSRLVRLTGDTMYDALLRHLPSAAASPVLKEFSLEPARYSVLTIHRPENVDDFSRLRNIVRAVSDVTATTFVIPVHPRTKRRLIESKLLRGLQMLDHVILVRPLGYHEMISLVKNAQLLLTDSGGLQKEAFWLGTQCVTLRESTEWVETVRLGVNVLAGNDVGKIVNLVTRYLAKGKLSTRLKEKDKAFGDGHAADAIVESLLEETHFG